MPTSPPEVEGQNYFKFLVQENGHIFFLNQNVGTDGTATCITLTAGEPPAHTCGYSQHLLERESDPDCIHRP